jgi:hypothetical protein
VKEWHGSEDTIAKDTTRTRWYEEPGEYGRSVRENGRRQNGNKGPRRQKPLYLRKERTTTNGIERWSSGQQSPLGSGGTLKKAIYEIFRGKITKQIVGSSIGLRKIKDWTLWRGRPPPKRK